MDIHAAIDDARFLRFHRKLVAACLGGPILDGYILSIIAIALIGISADFRTSTLETSLIGASALVGIFLGAALFGPLTDRFGRRFMYTVDLWVLVAGSVLQFFVQDASQLITARFALGIAIGANYPIVNALLAEWLPRQRRGQILGLLQAGWFIGAALASVVGYVMFEFLGAASWRWMLVSSAAAGLIVLMLQHGAPESARWLLQRGRASEAKTALRAALADQPGTSHVVLETPGKQSTAPTGMDLRILLQPVHLRRIIFCGGFYALQVVPLFAIYTFGPTFLSALGIGQGNASTQFSVVTNLVFLAGCLAALGLVDTWGRRPLILCSFALMSIPLFILGFIQGAPAGVVMACFCSYAFFSGGPNILEWVYPSELFPAGVRASAIGISTAVSRSGAAVGIFGLPFAVAEWGVGTAMLTAGAITTAGFLLCIFLAIETKGTRLEQCSGAKTAENQPADGTVGDIPGGRRQLR